MRIPGAVLSRDQLLEHVARSINVCDRAINGHMKRLRAKFLRADPRFDLIETIYGVGCRLKE
jgi:two-component system, OmpR family, response regulator ChvI